MQPQRHFSVTLAVCTGMIMVLSAAFLPNREAALRAQSGNPMTVRAVEMMHSSDVTVSGPENEVTLFGKPGRKTYLYAPLRAMPFTKFRLHVEAAGQSGDGRWPNLAIALNDTAKFLQEITVTNAGYQTYDLGSLTAPAGATLYLIFPNDYYNPVNRADVNLKIRQAVLTPEAQEPFIVNDTLLTLVWNRNTEADLGGYRIYKGMEPGKYGLAPVEVSKDSASQVFPVSRGFKYYFAIAAYDTANNQSALSPEIVAQVQREIVATSDLNGDSRCDSEDVKLFSAAFGATCGNRRYNQKADFNGDCRIDGYDQIQFGKSCK